MNSQTATLALGCFWGPDARFGAHPAVVRTRVGYAGGSTPDPSYQHISDYIEAIEIDFDASILDYAQILDLFWQFHTPTSPAYKRQYTSAIFPHNQQQLDCAAQSMQSQQNVTTDIISLERFYLAEDYHQKYHLQQYPQLMSEFNQRYPNFHDFINSTLAARANGALAGYVNPATLEQTFADAPNIQQQLINLIRR